MELKSKNILLISPEPWDHIFVSKHHYAVHLGKCGNQVFFLNPPQKKEGITATSFLNVSEVNYKGFPRGLRYYPGFFQKKIISLLYKQMEKMCGVNFDVVWSFDNSVFYDFSVLPSGVLKISHIVDANQDFQTEKAARTADICLAVTEQIKNRLYNYNRKVYKIGHGFCPTDSVSVLRNRSLGNKIKAVYAGNLAIPYIDWELIWGVVEKHADVDFIFIGPNSVSVDEPNLRSAKEEVLKSANASFPGAIPFGELQHYYSAADVLFLAYQEKYHDTQVANSHKMMEYLGSGKVIVATKTSEYFNFHPLIAMSEKNDEFPRLFDTVLSNLDYYNSQEIQSQRIAFAMDNTYERQIRRIEQIINGK